MTRPLLLDIGAAGCCTDHALESIYKSLADPPGASIWNPHHDPFVREHIEDATLRGLRILSSIEDDLTAAVSGKAISKRGLFAKAIGWTRMSEDEMASILERLEGRDPATYSLRDWLSLVDWIVHKYLPEGVIDAEADYLAVRSVLAGKVQAQMQEKKVTQPAVAAVVAALPGAVPAGWMSRTESFIVEFARLRAAELITEIGEKTRHRLGSIILQHEADRALGDPKATLWALQQQMRDEFMILNRDWRRIALTETARNANEGLLASLKPGTRVRRIEAYEGACPFCRKIHGMEFTVVEPTKRGKNGWREVWVGKTNVGRSASPRKRVGDELVERDSEELWWPAAGTMHPNCFVNPGVGVYTSTGWRAISTIKVGDQVLTHKGRFRSVNWVLDDRDGYKGRVIQFAVSTEGRNRQVSPAMTPEHPVLTDRGWVAAADVVIGDQIRHMAKTCVTCGDPFVNRHKGVVYCGSKCVPRSGKNQFSTENESDREKAIEVTRRANVERMRRMTIEQRKELTSAAREAVKKTGFVHLRDPEIQRLANAAVSRTNYRPSEAEAAIAGMLEAMGIAAEMQYRINKMQPDSAGRPRYWWADIALPEHGVVVEIDGRPWHGGVTPIERDIERDADIEAQGWTVLRFDAALAKSNPRAVADEVARRAINHSGEYVFTSLRVDDVSERLLVKRARLFNFGVQDDESYVVAGGLVVHNCRGTWQPIVDRPPDVDPDFADWLDAELAKAG